MRPSEDDLIARYFAPLAGPGGLGLKDDAALIAGIPGLDLVVTVDAIVAGIHFLPDDPPGTIGAKALGVNLSDLAAKGADPAGFLLALALPADWTADWLAAFAEGLGLMAAAQGCPLLGGDTVATPGPLTISVTAFGHVPAGRMVRRTTARSGDLLCVTGTIGDAALGLDLLTGAPPRDVPFPLAGDGGPRVSEGRMRGVAPSAEVLPSSDPASPGHRLPQRERGCTQPRPAGDWRRSLAPEHRAVLVDRYRRPQPRLALAAALREHAGAAMDVSDGLVGDAAKLLRASGVTGTLDLDRIPLSPPARAALAAEATVLDRIAGGGDDYEILLTLLPGRLDAMIRAAAALGLAVTVVGEVRDGEGPPALRLNGSPHALATPSFQHFGAGR